MASVKGQCTLPWGTFNNSRNGMPNSVSSDDLVDCYEDLSYKNLEAQGELWLPLPAAEKETDKHKTMRRVILVLILCATIVGISWGVMQVMSSKNGSSSDPTEEYANTAYIAADSDDSSSFMYEEHHHGREDSNSHKRDDDHSSEDGNNVDSGSSGDSFSNSDANSDLQNSEGDHVEESDHSHNGVSDIDIWKEIIALEMFETFRHSEHPERGRNPESDEELEASIRTIIGLYWIKRNPPIESRLEKKQSNTGTDSSLHHMDSHTDHSSSADGSDEMLSDLEEALIVYEKIMKEQEEYEEQQRREEEEQRKREEEERQQREEEEEQQQNQKKKEVQQVVKKVANSGEDKTVKEESIIVEDSSQDHASDDEINSRPSESVKPEV